MRYIHRLSHIEQVVLIRPAEMKDRRSPNTVDVSRFFSLIAEVVSVRRHIDLMRWLQGEAQQYLPHDILVAAWGDFHLGLIHYDVVSAMPGVRSESADSELITPLLKGLFERWLEQDRKPFVLHAGEQGFGWDSSDKSAEICKAMHSMRSSLIHGISDHRGRHDCLYVLFNTQTQRDRQECKALKFLLPYIDSALRQVELMPHQSVSNTLASKPAVPDPSSEPASTDGVLSAREAEIMKWVAMGKTNGEIGSILNVSSFTVKNHMQRIFKKLDVFSRAQAVSAYMSAVAPVGSA